MTFCGCLFIFSDSKPYIFFNVDSFVRKLPQLEQGLPTADILLGRFLVGLQGIELVVLEIHFFHKLPQFKKSVRLVVRCQVIILIRLLWV